jgi:hypothetical protein
MPKEMSTDPRAVRARPRRAARKLDARTVVLAQVEYRPIEE